MARKLRLIYPGVAVHIIQRGVNRVPCFRADTDYLVYLSQLRQYAAQHGCAGEGSCTAMMRDLGRRYVPYFNARHERTGTLWEGRFRSCLVQSAHYVLACYRYIELNPVRADMVNHPAGYFWSSYAVNSGGRSDPFVAEHPEFTALSGEAERRQSAYRGLFDGTMDAALLEAIREATNGGFPLASDDFKKSVLAPLGWKIGPGKPGPRANSHPDPELVL